MTDEISQGLYNVIKDLESLPRYDVETDEDTLWRYGDYVRWEDVEKLIKKIKGE